jgi:hypothetical protein
MAYFGIRHNPSTSWKPLEGDYLPSIKILLYPLYTITPDLGVFLEKFLRRLGKKRLKASRLENQVPKVDWLQIA